MPTAGLLRYGIQFSHHILTHKAVHGNEFLYWGFCSLIYYRDYALGAGACNREKQWSAESRHTGSKARWEIAQTARHREPPSHQLKLRTLVMFAKAAVMRAYTGPNLD